MVKSKVRGIAICVGWISKSPRETTTALFCDDGGPPSSGSGESFTSTRTTRSGALLEPTSRFSFVPWILSAMVSAQT